MSEQGPGSSEFAVAERLAAVEKRLSHLEAYLGIGPGEAEAESVPAKVRPGDAVPGSGGPAAAEAGEELELVVGQSWFAQVGLVVLTLGGAFALSLPYRGFPAALPSVLGYALALTLFLVARAVRGPLPLVAAYLPGVGMALQYFATLRLFFFGATPVLSTETWVGRGLLVAVVGVNVALAWRRGSPRLMGLALATGYATAVAVGTPGFVFGAVLTLSTAVVVMGLRRGWTGLLLFGTVAAYLTHLLWALNNPVLGRPVQLVSTPAGSVGLLLAYAVVLAMGMLLRRDRSTEPPAAVGSAVVNCALGYGLFLVHTFAVYPAQVVPWHALASVVFLGLAIAFWRAEASRGATFFYAMTGYAALSVALMRAVAPPEVFVWLSVQSVVVVATALWFRSRFIVVANFAIFLMIVIGYVLTHKGETGISLGFGLVALISARVLRWQQQRLELKTEVMRNAYLASAFVVFPYALYHLVPRTYVAVAWVGVAVAYYLLNLIVRSPKYRWMGHLTLLLTVLYVLVIGITQLEATYRVLSFLVLGTVLLVVSLVFTRLRGRREAGRRRGGESEGDGEAPGAAR